MDELGGSKPCRVRSAHLFQGSNFVKVRDAHPIKLNGICNPVRNVLCRCRNIESCTKRKQRVYKTRRASYTYPGPLRSWIVRPIGSDFPSHRLRHPVV